MATTLLSPGALLALALLLSVCWAQPQDNTIRLNHIQVQARTRLVHRRHLHAPTRILTAKELSPAAASQTLHVHNTYHQCPVASMDALYNRCV